MIQNAFQYIAKYAGYFPKEPLKQIRMLLAALIALVWGIVLLVNHKTFLGDPDIWWHIRTGQWMWDNATFPTSDPFSFTFADKPWIAKEWLSQIILFGAFNYAGWNAIALIAMITVTLSAVTLFWILSDDLNPIKAALACLTSLSLGGTTFVVRPHLLTLPLLIIWTHQLFRASRESRAPHFGLLLVLIVWANLHAAFTIGLLVSLFAFFDFLERTRFSHTVALKNWLLFLALCPLVTCIHPYFWRAILATLTVVTANEAVPMIVEWGAFSAQNNTLYVVVLLSLVFGAIVSGFRIGFAKAMLIIVLLYLFLIHIRYAFYFFPILAILCAPEISKQFPRSSAYQWANMRRDKIETVLSSNFKFLLSMCCVAYLAIAWALQSQILKVKPPEAIAVTAAIAAAKSHQLKGHVFNYYDFGGPLIFNNIKTFIDGRTDQLFLEGFTKNYMLGPDTADELSEALQKYDISWTLLNPNDPRVGMLDTLPGWTRIFTDEFATIHHRDQSIPTKN